MHRMAAHRTPPQPLLHARHAAQRASHACAPPPPSPRFVIQLLPAAVVAPLYFQGKIDFGVINQSQSAFNHILSDVSLVRPRTALARRACPARRRHAAPGARRA